MTISLYKGKGLIKVFADDFGILKERRIVGLLKGYMLDEEK